MTAVKSPVPLARVEHAMGHVAAGLGLAAAIIAPPVLRLALATPFFRSGLTRWDGFLSLSPSAVYLFEDEFKLHIFGGLYDFPYPAVIAHLVATAEITLPILLVLGFATRFVAIQLVVPDGWANFHLPWAGLALAIMALAPAPCRSITPWTGPAASAICAPRLNVRRRHPSRLSGRSRAPARQPSASLRSREARGLGMLRTSSAAC